MGLICHLAYHLSRHDFEWHEKLPEYLCQEKVWGSLRESIRVSREKYSGCQEKVFDILKKYLAVERESIVKGPE